MRPLYKAAFTIENQGLDSLVDLAEKWLEKKVPIPEKFREGIELNYDKDELESIKVERSGEKYFGFRFTEPDKQGSKLLWRTSVSMSEKEAKESQVSLVLESGREDGKVNPHKPNFRRPKLVHDFVNKFPTIRGKYSLKPDEDKVFQRNSRQFLDMVQDAERELPIVYISQVNRDRVPLVDPRSINFQLAGIAHTFLEAEPTVSNAISSRLGSRMNCYNGAVRIFWPVEEGEEEFSDPYRHRLWTPESLKEKENFSEELLKIISAFSAGAELPLDLGTIKELDQRNRYDNLRSRLEAERAKQSETEDTSIYELAEEYAQENDKLKKELENSEEKNRNYEREIIALENRSMHLEEVINNQKSGQAEKQDPIFTPDNLEDALKIADEKYPQLEVSGKVRKQIKNNPYENPQQILNAFKWLAENYLSAKKGKGIRERLEKDCLEKTGMRYSAHQSKTTMGKFPQDYEMDYKGRKVLLQEHLGSGTTKDPTKAIRIAFHHDQEESKLVIGYIGVHQKNRN